MLVLPDGSDDYVGVYWANAAMAVTGELGSDLDRAISDFRDLLRERGEA